MGYLPTTLRIMCHNELKMGLVAQGCMWNGSSTFLYNLLLVSNDSDLVSQNQWQAEYAKGSQQEIYRAPGGHPEQEYASVYKLVVCIHCL